MKKTGKEDGESRLHARPTAEVKLAGTHGSLDIPVDASLWQVECAGEQMFTVAPWCCSI